MSELEELRKTVERLKALAAEHDHCTGCPTPWWLRAALDEVQA